MGFFVSEAIAVGDDQVFIIGDTWSDITVNPTWAVSPDSTADCWVWGSADEGQTWFELTTFSGSPSPQYVTGKPVNALKLVVTAGAPGQALTAQITGVS